MKKSNSGFPLTEALVFDIVDYLLTKDGYAFSNEISYHIVDANPRRYTSREVVGILRNRPMFQHRQSSDRRAGIRWRLNLLTFEEYLHQKGFEERAKGRDFYERMRDLKKQHIVKTMELISEQEAEQTDELYEQLSKIWV
jgi:rubrerythrin|tara:strand:+ start:530 stop:949 length:420 start_codon:yes stop_codon:yes gene_type:complete